MKHTTIALPEDLKRRALERAHESGIPFAEFVRQALEARLRSSADGPHGDPLFAATPIFRGSVPSDLSEDHDRYLYEEPA
jgi:hypothetical protein